MCRCFILLGILILAQNLKAQTDTLQSTYKNLRTIVFYKASTSFEMQKGKSVYFVNKKAVNFNTYLNYYNGQKSLDSCRPCLLKTYDYNSKLISEGIQYTDCRVGFWVEYDNNGKVKTIGHYKENPLNNWSKILEDSLCSLKHGVWMYFDKKGKIIKTEDYKKGKLTN